MGTIRRVLRGWGDIVAYILFTEFVLWAVWAFMKAWKIFFG